MFLLLFLAATYQLPILKLNVWKKSTQIDQKRKENSETTS